MPPNDRREVTLADVLDELKSQGSKKKDWWERLVPVLTVLSTLVLGAAGLWFTKSYNDRQAELAARQAEQDKDSKRYQTRVLEMQTVEKFVPYLTDKDEGKKEMALLIITTLGSPEFATQFVKLNPSKGTQAAADRIMAGAAPSGERESPEIVASKPSSTAGVPTAKAPTKTGWVYLGQYDPQAKQWQTQYFNFSASAEPSSLRDTVQTVRARTGDINVRAGMPSPTGQFPRVREVLRPNSPVKVRSIQEWYSTGYMWAEIDYQTAQPTTSGGR
jgi:hypothetical protein